MAATLRPYVQARGQLEVGRSPRSSRSRRGRPNSTRRDSAIGLGMLLPTLSLVAVVTGIPIVRAVALSLHYTNFLTEGRFAGLAQYRAFFGDAEGRRTIVTTLLFTAGSLILTVPIATGLALLLNQRFRFRTAVRTVLMLPWIVSPILTALMWGWTVDPTIGPVPYVVSRWFGMHTALLANPGSAMATLVVVNVWRTFPYGMILILAALQTIPAELHEAATVDGAGAFRRFWSVTLPGITGTMLVVVIILTVNAVNMVDLPLILTGGGPTDSTNILGLSVYHQAFVLNHFGYASAIAVVMFAINAIISIAYIRVLRREP